MENKKDDGSITYIGFVYRHWIINDKKEEVSYIGITINKPEIRWGKDGKGYKPRKKGADSAFWRAIKKYGWDNFNHDIIEVVERNSIEELDSALKQLEIHYIQVFDSFNNGYNMTTGGDLGCIRSQETREKHRKAQTGKKYNEESRKRMSESAKKKPPVSEETRRKQSEVRKGVLVGERNPMYGRTGEKNPFYGQKHTDEKRKQMSQSQKKLYENGYVNPNKGKGRKVVCINTEEIFNNANEANDKYRGNIRACCNKKAKHAGRHPETGEKLSWMYYDEYLKLKEKDDNKDE